MQQTESEASTFNVLVANFGMPTPIAWPGRAAFLEMLSQRPLGTDTIVLYDAPIDQLRDLLELAEQGRILRFNILFHDSYTGEAVIRVPSIPNSDAIRRISCSLWLVLANLGFIDFVEWYSGAAITSPDGRYTAEPDTSFLPTSRGANPGTRFPSVMFEVGMTQSRPSLRRVMRGWFEMSGGLVKIVILVDIRCRLSGDMKLSSRSGDTLEADRFATRKSRWYFVLTSVPRARHTTTCPLTSPQQRHQNLRHCR
jgi:hypothetical protein